MQQNETQPETSYEDTANVLVRLLALPQYASNAEMWGELGAVYFHLQKFEGARDAFLKSIAIHPDKSNLIILAGCYTELQDLQNALSAYRRAFDLDPKDAEVAMAMAWVCMMLRQREQGARWMSTAVRLDPSLKDSAARVGTHASVVNNR